jgi:hypothetical protein
MPSILNRHQRRALEAAERSPAKLASILRPVADARDLTNNALARLVANLEGFGTVLSTGHREALLRILGMFSLLASGKSAGRYAFDLDTGCGKTQAVVAWCAALVESGLPWSVAVACSKVEALCTLKRDLIRNGVPAEKIGLRHSYGDAASEACDADAEERPILLLTHNRVRGSVDLERSLRYRGKRRDLTIWDESLLVSDHRALAKQDVDFQLGGLTSLVEKLPETHPAKAERLKVVAYLQACSAALDADLRRQADPSEAPSTLHLPTLEEADAVAYEQALERFGPRRDVSLLVELLRISQMPVRVVPVAQGEGALITYTVAVPPSLNRVAVLDASFGIRELEQLDPTIRKDQQFNGRVKNYSRVTIHTMKHAAGRGAMTNSFREERAERRLVSREVVELVKTLPESEGVLVFTFKARSWGPQGVDFAGILKADLRAAGVDIEAKVEVGGERLPRFVWLTWGNETSLSEHAYCPNVIFAGVLHRSDADLAGAMVGQRQDLLSAVTAADIAKVKRSEVAHGLYQAMSRGSCRIVENGEARPMRAWFMSRDKQLRGVLSEAMPGVTWAPWAPKVISISEGKVESLAGRIAGHLTGLKGTSTMSTRRFKELVLTGGESVPAMTWKRALHRALEDSPEWSLVGRSVVRLGAVMFPEAEAA